MSHPVPPVSGFRRHGRNALISATAAGLILGGPTAAFASEAPVAETTGTFGQEVLPATGEATVAAPAGYETVQEVAAQVISSETAGVVAEIADAVAPVPPADATEQTVADPAAEVAAAEAAPEAATGPASVLAPAVLAPATPVLDPFAQLQVEAAETVAPVEAITPVQPETPIDTGIGDPTVIDAPVADSETPIDTGVGIPPAPADPVVDPAPVEEPNGGEVATPATPQQRAYNDENTVVEVPEQYRTSDFYYVLAGPDGSAVPVSLDADGRVVLTPALVKDLAGGDYLLRAVQGFDGSSADISAITLVIPTSAPTSELAPTVTAGSDLIGTIDGYSKGQKIVVRDAQGAVVDGAKVTISDNGFYVVEGLTDGGYTLEVVGADGNRVTKRSSVTLQAPAETNTPVLSTPEKITAGKPLAVDGTGYETKVELDENGGIVSYGTVTVKVTDPITGEVVDQRIVQLNEDGSFDYELSTNYSAKGFERLVITVTERDGMSTTRTELVAVEGNGTPVIKAPSVVAGKAPTIGGSKLVPGEEYTVVVVGPLKFTQETLVAGPDGTLNLKLADNLLPGDYRVELRNANGAPVPGQAATFQVQSDRDGDGIPDSEDDYDGPGATPPVVEQPGPVTPGPVNPDPVFPGPVTPGPVNPAPVDPTIPSVPDVSLPGPVDPTTPGVETPAPTEPTAPVETPGSTDPTAPPVQGTPTVPIGEDRGPVAPVTPEDGSIGQPVLAPAPALPGQDRTDGVENPTAPVSLVEKLFGPDKTQDAAPIVNNLEQRLDASPLSDTIKRVTGLDFSRDLSERGSFQAAPNLGDMLDRVKSSAPGLDRGPVPMASGDRGATPEAIDLRDADTTTAERAGAGQQAGDGISPASIALGLLGLGAIGGGTYYLVRRGESAAHRA